MNLETDFIGLKLKNPLFIASGIAGFGEEYSRIINLNILGGFITKTVTLKQRIGNPPPRIIEVQSGIINTIGLENPGIEKFIQEKMPFIRKYFNIPVIISIGGETIEEFVRIVKKLDKLEGISAIELNLSCPNVRKKTNFTKLISQDTKLTYSVIKAVKKNTCYPVVTKLTPAVTDITEVAIVCQEAGSDAISLINTYPALSFSKSEPRSVIAGGLSGPCIKPIALRMVYEVAKRVNIPIMGMGGICSADDVIDFISAGAKTVAIGSALFRNPKLPEQILSYLTKKSKYGENN